MSKKSESESNSSGADKLKYASSNDSEIFSDLDEPVLDSETGKFVLIKFFMDEGKSKIKHYIGEILEQDDNDYFKMKFLRKTGENNRFIFLAIDDIACIEKENLIRKVKTQQLGTTSRQNRHFLLKMI